MAMYTHFVITRFNLKTKFWEKDKNNKIILTDEWMQYRFNLFLDYTFPSMTKQSNLNFVWLVYFDTDTKGIYRNKIRSLEEIFPCFRPRFINGYEVFRPSLRADINEFKGNLPFIITSRIDNDDCFHQDTIKVLQDSFIETDYLPINLLNGICYDIQSGKLTGYKVESSPFISLIEKAQIDEEPKTVYFREHQNFIKYDNIKQIRTGTYWLQLIHNDNMMNKLEGCPSRNYSLLGKFNFNVGYTHVGFGEFMLDLFTYYSHKLIRAIKIRTRSFRL